MKQIKERILAWYEGEFIPYENDPHSLVVMIGGRQQRHWTAEGARALVAFWLRHWQWIIGITVAVAAILSRRAGS